MSYVSPCHVASPANPLYCNSPSSRTLAHLVIIVIVTCSRKSLRHFKANYLEIAVLIILIRISRHYLEHACSRVSFTACTWDSLSEIIATGRRYNHLASPLAN